MVRSLTAMTLIGSALLAPAVATADEPTVHTLPAITVYGRPSRPSVVIAVTRETPNVGLKPLVAPKSFIPKRTP